MWVWKRVWHCYLSVTKINLSLYYIASVKGGEREPTPTPSGTHCRGDDERQLQVDIEMASSDVPFSESPKPANQQREGGAGKRSRLLKRWLGEHLEVAWRNLSLAARKYCGTPPEANSMLRHQHAQQEPQEEDQEVLWSMAQERHQHALEPLLEENQKAPQSTVREQRAAPRPKGTGQVPWTCHTGGEPPRGKSCGWHQEAGQVAA